MWQNLSELKIGNILSLIKNQELVIYAFISRSYRNMINQPQEEEEKKKEC